MVKLVDWAGNETILENKQAKTLDGEDIVCNGNYRNRSYTLTGNGNAYVRNRTPPVFVHMSTTSTNNSKFFWKLNLDKKVKKVHFDFSITDGGSNRGIPGGYVFVTRNEPGSDYAPSELGKWQWAPNDHWQEEHYVYDMSVSGISGTIYLGFQRYWRDVSGEAFIDLNIHQLWYEY